MGSSPVLFLLLVLAHAFFVAAEVAIVSLDKARLSLLTEKEHYAARLIERFAHNTVHLSATTQLVTKSLSFLAVVMAIVHYSPPLATQLAQLAPGWAAVTHQSLAIGLIALVLMLAMVFLGEMVPRVVAARYPERVALLTIYPVTLLGFIALPLARAGMALHAWLTGSPAVVIGASFPTVTEEQIKTLVDAGEEGGVIEEEEREMIYSIFELGDTLAREVMVPRIDMVALEVNASIEEALHIIMRAGHSRIPVYEETIDNIVGILYAKDILKYWPHFETLRLRDILREAYFVPETKPVDELLQELQRRKVHIAIVVDEYGGVAGLVTIEDILEEIVGEIQDEYDSEEPSLVIVSPDEVVCEGRTDLDDINAALHAALPTDVSDTVGGLIYSCLGRVAVAGDQVRFGDLELTVLAVAGRRIKKVRVQRLAADQPASSIIPCGDGNVLTSQTPSTPSLPSESPSIAG
ncbi:MAG: hemolysin family protein [Anaerolineae bacterium]|nr:hemolysin family protein [Anaerolineae bacterium]